MFCQIKKQVELLLKGEKTIMGFSLFLLRKEACRKLDKIILTAITAAVAAICTEIIKEQNKED